MKSLENLIQQKTDLIAISEDDFLKSLTELLPDNQAKIKEYLKSLDTVNGKFVSSKYNRDKLIELRKFLIKTLASDYNINFEAYIKKFDDITNVNVSIQAVQGIEVNAVDFGFAKKIMTDLVTDQLSLDNVIDQAVRPGIQQILYKNVMGGSTRKEAESSIENFLKDKDYIKRWSKVIARDTLRTYDENIQDTLLEKFDYDGYFYTGSLIETSRPLCEHWVYDLKGFVTFEEMAKTAEQYPDKVEQKTKYTIADFKELRYNCRHTATLGFLTERIKRKRNENKH